MTFIDHPVFRHFWYPVARADALGTAPIARHLLGEELVIWSPAPGIVSAAVDRCPHRDARLSTGWLDDSCGLVCPYHGWVFGEDGAPTSIPQLPDASAYPSKATLTTYRAVERYGWIWVALAEPYLPIPDIAQIDDGGWRVVDEPESDWACTSAHLVDNNIDPAHIAYVHRASFGTPERPEVPVADVRRTGTGISVGYQVDVESRPGEVGGTTRTTRTLLHGPFLMQIHITYPDGLEHMMIKACTPSTDSTVHQLQMVIRNDDEAQRPAADIIAFDDQVWHEDKAVLEHCWTDFRTDLTGNVHLKTDRASIEYRRWLGELMADGPAVFATASKEHS